MDKQKILKTLVNLLSDSSAESHTKRKNNIIYSDSESDQEITTPPKRRRIIIQSDSEDESEKSSVDVLKLVGEQPVTECKIKIHSDIVKLWRDIMSKGLEKEAKDRIIKKIPVLENCDVTAPALNNEIRATLSSSAKTRDERLQAKQNQIGVVITSLNEVLKSLINTNNETMIEKISDNIRLLCDLQFMESQTRRALILPGLNKNIKEHLEKTEVGDCLLFGKNVSEIIKETKILERSSNDLRKTKEKPSNFTKSPESLNFWGPSTSKKQGHLGGQSQYYRGHPQYYRSRQPTQRTPRLLTRGASRTVRGKNQWHRKKE